MPLAAGTESAATETVAAVSNKLQAQYDITKALETDVLLQQVTQFVHKALCLASQRSGQCLWLRSHIQTCHNKHRSHASMQPLVKHYFYTLLLHRGASQLSLLDLCSLAV